VLVSAALSPAGKPARIIEAVRSGQVVLVVSPHLLAELDDVLGRPKLAALLDPDALEGLR
jgi:predicted nucleic acid-binding protein